MDQTDTQISHLDWTTMGSPAQSPTRVIIQAGQFEGIEGELIQSLGAGRVLVFFSECVLIEIYTSVLGICAP